MRDLVWGTSAEQAAAARSLDTATAFAVLTAKHATNVTLDLAEYTLRVGSALGGQARHPRSERSQGMHGVAIVYGMRGQLREGLKRWAESWKFSGRMSSEAIVYNVDLFQLLNAISGTGDTLRAPAAYTAFAEHPDSVLADDVAVILGLYAAHGGLWQDLERWARVAGQGARAAAGVGDSTASRRLSEDARVLTALLAEHRGERGAAVRELERAVAMYPGSASTPGSATGPLLRYELARRYLASGDFRSAKRQLASFYGWDYPANAMIGVVEVYRGRAAEGLGEPDEARAHYANVVRWWKDCDPEARPVYEEARAALARLTGEPIPRSAAR
jgi:tetratricopeptide (TPR) repeat protein